MSNLSELARGKWRGILTAMGIDSRVLTGKHCPCPVCRNGTDRFRFDDKDRKGTWICSHCGAGDGFSLLMKVKGLDFKECCMAIEPILGVVKMEAVKAERTAEQMREMLRAMWKASLPVQADDQVDIYLAGRGLKARPACLRLIEKCRTSRGVFSQAMLAMVSNADGTPLTIHRTYLKDGGKADMDNPREMMAGKLTEGCAVRLSPPAERMGIAEGIETALAAAQLFDMPVWASTNATILEKWLPPQECRHVTIFGDADENFTGQRATYVLANRLAMKGYEVGVMLPKSLGTDWNDVLLRGGIGNAGHLA